MKRIERVSSNLGELLDLKDPQASNPDRLAAGL